MSTVEQRLVDLHDEVVDVIDGLDTWDEINGRADYRGAEAALTGAARAVTAALRAISAESLRRDLPPFRSEDGDGADDEVRALRA